MTDEISFSEDALEIIDLIENSDENLFITGKAGTGKSTLLEHVSAQDKDIIVLAPTGIAAINVKGETIHSFFKLKPGYELDEAKHVRINDKMELQYSKLHTVIIDEISMVRADLFDAINVFLQRVRSNPNPFGGVRMILFGDLFQLPPVLLREKREKFLEKYKSPYFFSAHVFQQEDLFISPFILKKCILNIIYRQKDPEFTSILNSIRTNTIEPKELSVLNQQVKPPSNNNEDDFQINLVSTNALAKKINMHNLSRIDENEIKFSSFKVGNIENLHPNDDEVIIKIGAQVMFLNNDSQKRWANGTIGKVTALKKGIDLETSEPYKYLKVELENGKSVSVSPFTWGISKYKFKAGEFKREELGSFTQIPVKLAWAITIHKSQGKTFNKVKIDLGRGSFVHGQTYVALSRCRTLKNITLTNPISMSDIIVDKDVVNFING